MLCFFSNHYDIHPQAKWNSSFFGLKILYYQGVLWFAYKLVNHLSLGSIAYHNHTVCELFRSLTNSFFAMVNWFKD